MKLNLFKKSKERAVFNFFKSSLTKAALTNLLSKKAKGKTNERLAILGGLHVANDQLLKMRSEVAKKFKLEEDSINDILKKANNAVCEELLN